MISKAKNLMKSFQKKLWFVWKVVTKIFTWLYSKNPYIYVVNILHKIKIYLLFSE